MCGQGQCDGVAHGHYCVPSVAGHWTRAARFRVRVKVRARVKVRVKVGVTSIRRPRAHPIPGSQHVRSARYRIQHTGR